MGGAPTILGGATNTMQQLAILHAITSVIFLTDTVQTVQGLSVPSFTSQPTDRIAALGGLVELNCQATGDPSPTYSYTHNNSLVTNDLTGRVTMQDGKLTIQRYAISDAGQYVCTASNSQGSSNSQTATLRTAYIADVFTTYPTSQTLLVHTSFSITCTIDSLPDADIMFFQNTDQLDASSDNRLTTTTVSQGSRLNINDIQFSDAGGYSCDASNSVNSGYTTGATITITVQGPPEFAGSPQSQSVPERFDIRFDCVVTAVPAATVTWTTPGGSALPSTASPRFTVLSNNSLKISTVQKSDAGLYTCSASNKFGSPSVSLRLTVLDPLSKPSFTTSPVNVTAVATTSITMNCVASGNPSPAITWNKNGEKLTFNSRVTFLASQGVLRITSVQSEDGGQYRCTATNSQGSVATMAVLTVQVPPVVTSPLPDLVQNEGTLLTVNCAATGKPTPSITFGFPSTAKALTNIPGRLIIASLVRDDAGSYSCTAKNTVGQHTRQFSLRVQGKPYFDRMPNDVAVTAGATVTFYCDVAGDPLPTKAWSKSNRKPLPTDPRISTPSTGELQIKNVLKTDAGIYECRATNSFGEVTASGVLSIHVFPSFTQRPVDIEIVQGGTASFECLATGSPSPTYTWAFPNGSVATPSPSSRFSSDGGMFTIRKLSAADQGRYTCIATNAAGSISSAASVTMLIFPTFTVSPRNTIIVAGQTAKFSCAATGINQPTISWVLVPTQGNKLPLTSARYSVTSTGTLSISDIKKTDEGTYECQANNRAGTDMVQASLTVHIQPVAYLTQTPLTVTLGQDGVWRCNISEGDPAPTFKWTRDLGSSLPDVGRFVDSGDGFLAVTSVKLDDAGQYTCQATNYVGSSSTTGTLDVQVAPTISSVNAKPVPVGQTAILDCNATGLPTPSITWKFASSGKTISFTSPYSLASNGSLIVSLARASDRGGYECVATNTAGTASRTVQLMLILPPSQPSKPLATDVGANAVTLTWTVSDGGSPLIGHEVDYFLGTWLTLPTQYNGSTTQRITGLRGDTEYFFRVRARNIVGQSITGSTSDPVKTLVGGPSAPQSFNAEAIGSSWVELIWFVSEFPNGPLQYYEIEYESEDGIEDIPKVTLRYNNITIMRYTVTGLHSYISYVFRIRGNNGGDKLRGEQAETTAKTGEAVPNAAPQNVQLESAGRPEIVVSWQTPPAVGRNGPVVGYFLYYRLIPEAISEDREAAEYLRLMLNGEMTSYTLVSEGETNYGVVMSMFNNLGEGPNSTEVQLSTPPNFSEEQTADKLGSGKVTAIAVGVVGFFLLCALIVVSFWYRYKMRTAVLSMNSRDEELGNEDAVGGGRESGGNGYLPESPEVRSRNVRGKYKKRKSQKDVKTPPAAVSPLTVDTTDSCEGRQALQPESPRYAEPRDALIPRTETENSQAVTTGVANTVYAQVDLSSKRSKSDEKKKDELEERRREEERQKAIQEALRKQEEDQRQQVQQRQEAMRKQEEAQHKQMQERQMADSRKANEVRQKEDEVRRKREEKKRRDEEARRMKEIMKRDKKDRKQQEKAAKQRASTRGKGYNFTFESDFGNAGLF